MCNTLFRPSDASHTFQCLHFSEGRTLWQGRKSMNISKNDTWWSQNAPSHVSSGAWDPLVFWRHSQLLWLAVLPPAFPELGPRLMEGSASRMGQLQSEMENEDVRRLTRIKDLALSRTGAWVPRIAIFKGKIVINHKHLGFQMLRQPNIRPFKPQVLGFSFYCPAP